MPSRQIAFRKDILDELPALDKRYYIIDSKTPGLKLAVHPSGKKTFFLSRRVKGLYQRIKIGSYEILSIEQARNETKKLNSFIELGGDPHQDKRNQSAELTFNELYSLYYSEYAVVYTKCPDANKQTMEKHIIPVFGRKRLSSITNAQLRKLHLEIGSKRAGATANRILVIVNAVFNFGIKNQYWSGTNPCFGIKKFRTSSRDRFLTHTELKSFFDALAQENELMRHFFELLLYTGARKGNVLSMRWADIELKLCRWRIPDTHTKNKDVNIIALSESALQILTTRKNANDLLKEPSEFVFPGDGRDGYLKDPKKAFGRIKERMEVTDLRMHDLRRTLGSYMAITGASLPIIGKALNHKSAVSTSIYARLSQDPVLQAINTATSIMNSQISHSAN